jgi:hypothetical protein
MLQKSEILQFLEQQIKKNYQMQITCAYVSVPWEMVAYLSCMSSFTANSMEQLQLWIKNNLCRNTTPLITLWSKVFLERLIILQLDKKYPALYETPKFIIIVIIFHCFHIPNQINPLHNLPAYSCMLHFTVPFPSAFTAKTLYSHLSTSIHEPAPHPPTANFHLLVISS